MAAAVAREHGPGVRGGRRARGSGDAVDGLAEAALRPERRREAGRAAAGEGPRGLVPGPGSYGRNDAGDAALDAALLSKLTGRPVRVQYMRHEGTGWDPKGPAAVYRARAGLDAQGTVVAYDFLGKGFTRQDVATTESDPKDTLAGQLTGYAPKPTVIFQVPAAAYDFANKRCGWEGI